MNFKRWDRITGWVVFAIAAATYLLTMEPSSSLWDCAEFIATSYKLEVGHPPEHLSLCLWPALRLCSPPRPTMFRIWSMD